MALHIKFRSLRLNYQKRKRNVRGLTPK
uniref:Zinc finger CCCH domain-containing protein 13 isoform X3 n=1 Tax=Rhizophora mucronata TaxID=61149 RepID=A0A2P2MQ03_RHIMU